MQTSSIFFSKNTLRFIPKLLFNVLTCLFTLALMTGCKSEPQEVVPVVTSGLGAVFSPDGQKLAFYAYHEDDPSKARIYTANLDGSGLREVTEKDTAGMHTEPKWSDDGRKLGYSKFLSAGAKIMEVNVRTGESRELASVTDDGYHMFSSWDPKNPKGYYFFHWPQGDFEPDAYHFDGEAVQRLTNDGRSVRPQVTADGALYIAKMVDVEANDYQVYKYNSATSDFDLVSENDEFLVYDNGQIITQEAKEENTHFFLQNLDESERIPLGQVPFKSVMFQMLNPDKDLLAFNTMFEDGAEIYLLDVKTGEMTKPQFRR